MVCSSTLPQHLTLDWLRALDGTSRLDNNQITEVGAEALLDALHDQPLMTEVTYVHVILKGARMEATTLTGLRRPLGSQPLEEPDQRRVRCAGPSQSALQGRRCPARANRYGLLKDAGASSLCACLTADQSSGLCTPRLDSRGPAS